MANSDKGLLFEYEIVTLFQNQGYIARRNIPVINDLKQDATDADILAIKFVHPFRENRLICDCKNKVKPRPYERIFWAKGVGDFLGVSDVFVALPKTSPDIIKFANDGNVKIITEEIIGEYLAKMTRAIGVADMDFFESKFLKFNKDYNAYKDISSFYREVKLLYVQDNPYTSLNTVLDKLKLVVKKMHVLDHAKEDNILFSWKYVSYELITLVSIMILRICSDVLGFSKTVREEQIKGNLTYGDIAPEKIHMLLNNISLLANEIIKGKLGLEGYTEDSYIDLNQIDAPTYVYDIIGLVERALQSPDWYINLPQVISYMLFEVAMKNKIFSIEDFESIFGKDLSQEKVKAAKNIFSFVKSTCAYNIKDIFVKLESSDSSNLK